MKNELAKTNEAAIKLKTDELKYYEGLKVGDIFFVKNSSYNQAIKITEIYLPDKRKKNDWWIRYGSNKDYELESFSDSYSSSSLDKFIEEYGERKLLHPPSYYFNLADEIIKGNKSISDYKDKSGANVSDETALVAPNSKENLMALAKDLESKKRNVELIRQTINLRMDEKKAELEMMKDALYEIVADFKKKVEKIEKVIYTIELYLGIDEDVVQIQSGNPAPPEEPLSFRQSILFMDEEVGEPGQDGKGMDFTNIEDFDNWLLKYSKWYKKFNYELILPEKKGVICLRVRRDKKSYNDNPFVNQMMNEENMRTYFLIRNGENVYRIWGDIRVWKLFPNKSELQKLYEQWEKIDKSYNWDNAIEIRGKKIYDGDEAKEKIENEVFYYKQQLILLQGLIDRTEIFHPMKEHVQLMSNTALESGAVRFIYDEEVSLPSGRLSFRQWLFKINSKIHEGSRVLIVTDRTIRVYDSFTSDGEYVNGRYERSSNNRFDERFRGEHRMLPKEPQTGVYTVYLKDEEYYEEVFSDFMPRKEAEELKKKVQEDKYGVGDMYSEPGVINGKMFKVVIDRAKKIRKKPIIKYNPKDDIINYWDRYDSGHERKARLSWEIYPDSDLFILNYDAIDLNDVEFYLFDREGRRDYLTMMPVLKNIYDRMLAEQEKETQFIRGMCGQFPDYDTDAMFDFIKKYVKIFKVKVKWKRSIDDDDEKSWRIIKKMVTTSLKRAEE